MENDDDNYTVTLGQIANSIATLRAETSTIRYAFKYLLTEEQQDNLQLISEYFHAQYFYELLLDGENPNGKTLATYEAEAKRLESLLVAKGLIRATE